MPVPGHTRGSVAILYREHALFTGDHLWYEPELGQLDAVEDHRAAGGMVELKDGVLSVRDHGPGFKDADLPFVFDRFYRADDARKLPGSGLGLAIVRQAAEACGGFAEAQNAPGGGALLRVSFGAPVGFVPALPSV